MEAFTKKTLQTSRGYNYTYYTADGHGTLPTLFFQHGWPDHAAMWEGVAASLISAKYPIIIPDLLGYDGTDKPTDPAAYQWSGMTQDLVEIMDAEKASKVVSIGHDWGAACASRLYNYHADRVVGVVLLNVAYTPPSRQPFDLVAVNQMMEQTFGYPIISYWHLFTAPDGPALLKANLGRLFNAMHSGPDVLKQLFTTKDGLRDYLVNGGGGVAPVQPRAYAQDAKFRQDFMHRFTRDGFEGPLCWYKATTQNDQYESDKSLPEGADTVHVPVLFMGAKDDAVCRHEAIQGPIKARLLPHLEQTDIIDAGHWVPYEQPEIVAENIKKWLSKHYA
ncbi:hypothetical protein ACEQ8H_006751 [Pleosporales sp. CAS-2024a]